MRAHKLAPEPEFKFHDTRKWRFDFAFPNEKVAVEVEGGTWVSGRHNRGDGFVRDTEKYNAAAVLGWCVLRFTDKAINSGEAINLIREALESRAA